MKPECHHPPYIINTRMELPNQADIAALEKYLAVCAENNDQPISTVNCDISIQPIECSWCRKPPSDKKWADTAFWMAYLVALVACIYLIGVNA